MSAALNHTIVPAKDAHESAEFLAEILGRPAPRPWGPFVAVDLDNGVQLDFVTSTDDFPSVHYAFLVSEDVFDKGFARIQALGLEYWGDPHGGLKMQINTHDGGKGVYFPDPSGHFMEMITVPYGGWPE